MRSVRFSRLARSQLQAIARYLLEQTGDERTGEQFVRSIEAHMLKLAGLSATIGRPRSDLGEGLRSLPHQSHVIIFRYGIETIDVVQAMHSRQDIDAHFPNDDL